MNRRKIIPYNPKLKEYAKKLRNNSTYTEIMLWNYLKQKQIRGYDFDRQKPIDNFIVDFYCAKLKLVIEIDGDSHFSEEGKSYDKERTGILKSYGLRVIRFSNSDILNNFNTVRERIIDIE